MMESLGLSFATEFLDGNAIDVNQEITRVTGNPVQIAMAEERIIGILSKSSGIATAARRAFTEVGSHCMVVSGAWKKMPLEIKEIVRQAVRDGGVLPRISEKPFIYLDKNYIRILGGVKRAIKAVRSIGTPVVIQVRGEAAAVEDEAIEAAESGAVFIMVDTGRQDHVIRVGRALEAKGLRSKVRIAFAGNVSIKDLSKVAQLDLDAVDIGYEILDAPCLPMRFDVVEVA